MPRKIPYFKPKHQQTAARDYSKREDRLEANRFYACSRWRRVRELKVRMDPLCEPCLARGDVTPAEQVHHKLERRTHPHLAFDMDNLESVCVPCHNAKRAKR